MFKDDQAKVEKSNKIFNYYSFHYRWVTKEKGATQLIAIMLSVEESSGGQLIETFYYERLYCMLQYNYTRRYIFWNLVNQNQSWIVITLFRQIQHKIVMEINHQNLVWNNKIPKKILSVLNQLSSITCFESHLGASSANVVKEACILRRIARYASRYTFRFMSM